MPHAVFDRTSPRASSEQLIDTAPGEWRVYDRRTPHWWLHAPTKSEALRVWHELFRGVRR